MQAQLKKKTEIKIYILYVMKNIGYAVTFDKLNDTITADGPVNYFGFAECFSELLDTNNIIRTEADGEEGFMITEQGINVVDNLLDTLLPSYRRTALAAATRLTSFDKRGALIEHTTKKQSDGSYEFTFRVTEYAKVVFSVTLNLSTREQAERIEYNLSKNTDGVYKSIMALLSGQADYLLNDTL